MMSHTVVGWQIVSPDANATADFYNKLFGWKVDQGNAMGYRVIKSPGLEGGVWPGPQAERAFAQMVIAVPDVAAHVERATSLGAKVLVPVSALPDGDVMAVVADPAGLTFIVCNQKS